MEELYQQMLLDIREAEDELEKELDGVSEESAAVIITPGSWSIADCVVHITMIEFSVLGIIRQIPDESYSLSPVPFIIGREKLRELLLDRSRKIKLPDAFESRMEKQELQVAYKKLKSVRAMLKERISSGSIVSPEMIRVHPVLGDMTKIDWLFTVAFHSLRHTEQIKGIKVHLGK